MSHYMNLALIGVRLIAFVIFLIGLIGFVYVVTVFLLTRHMSGENVERFVACIPYLVAGVVIFGLSRRIGRLVSKGL
ncbi:MAG TPA: hypothetical protein VJ842_04360 [Pyrinomonadaceae bacterium]|nr:hypothetical protein [Pyrinomonadaceae bacterium]